MLTTIIIAAALFRVFTTIIIAAALCGQAPRNEIADSPRSANADLVAKQRTRRHAAYQAGLVRARAQAKVDAANAAAYEAEYKKMLPFLLEQQRMELERMSAIERNAALNRIARASEHQAAIADQEARRAQYLRWRYGY